MKAKFASVKRKSRIELYLITLGSFFLFLHLVSIPILFPFRCTGKTVSALASIYPEIAECISLVSLYPEKSCSYNGSSSGFLPWRLDSSEILRHVGRANVTLLIDCPTTKYYKCENNTFIRTADISGADFYLNCEDSVCRIYIKPHEPETKTPLYVYLASPFISIAIGIVLRIKYKSSLGIVFILLPVLSLILLSVLIYKFIPFC
jgi:hypothetical protein